MVNMLRMEEGHKGRILGAKFMTLFMSSYRWSYIHDNRCIIV